MTLDNVNVTLLKHVSNFPFLTYFKIVDFEISFKCNITLNNNNFVLYIYIYIYKRLMFSLTTNFTHIILSFMVNVFNAIYHW